MISTLLSNEDVVLNTWAELMTKNDYWLSPNVLDFLLWQYKMPARRPRNFSWFIDGFMAASGFPEVAGHFQYIKDQGISTIITLSEYKPPMEHAPPGEGFTHITIWSCIKHKYKHM